VNGEVHGGRPRPTGAVVPRKKKNKKKTHYILPNNVREKQKRSY
jgi:hypothetical protein